MAIHTDCFFYDEIFFVSISHVNLVISFKSFSKISEKHDSDYILYVFRYINCNAFGTASKGLAMNLHKALEAEHPALKLAQYRHLWVDLSHMMQQLGNYHR